MRGFRPIFHRKTFSGALRKDYYSRKTGVRKKKLKFFSSIFIGSPLSKFDLIRKPNKYLKSDHIKVDSFEMLVRHLFSNWSVLNENILVDVLFRKIWIRQPQRSFKYFLFGDLKTKQCHVFLNYQQILHKLQIKTIDFNLRTIILNLKGSTFQKELFLSILLCDYNSKKTLCLSFTILNWCCVWNLRIKKHCGSACHALHGMEEHEIMRAQGINID